MRNIRGACCQWCFVPITSATDYIRYEGLEFHSETRCFELWKKGKDADEAARREEMGKERNAWNEAFKERGG